MESAPENFPELLTLWLFERFSAFQGDEEKGCVIMPLELVESNGNTLKQCLIKCASHWSLPDPFLKWIEDHNHFCNSLVDRIVPGFPSDQQEKLWRRIEWKDEMMVRCEDYHYWVMDNKELIKNEIPFHDTELNVNLVEDVAIHRKIKVRVLNGAHTAMVPIALMDGLKFVSQAMNHSLISEYIKRMVLEEILPFIEAPEAELEQFASDVFKRFRNANIQHHLIDISLQSITKFRLRLLPTIKEYYAEHHKTPPLASGSLAALMALYIHQSQLKAPEIKANPENLTWMRQAWKEKTGYDDFAKTILGNVEFWQENLNDIPGLTDCFAADLQQLIEVGVNRFLQEKLG